MAEVETTVRKDSVLLLCRECGDKYYLDPDEADALADELRAAADRVRQATYPHVKQEDARHMTNNKSPLRALVLDFISRNPGCTMRDIVTGTGRKNSGAIRMAMHKLPQVTIDRTKKPARYTVAGA